jgi:hypothetical protein
MRPGIFFKKEEKFDSASWIPSDGLSVPTPAMPVHTLKSRQIFSLSNGRYIYIVCTNIIEMVRCKRKGGEEKEVQVGLLELA